MRARWSAFLPQIPKKTRKTKEGTVLNIPFFSLLQRSLLRELTQTFVMCVASLLSLILISRGLHMRELILGLDFSFSDIALLFLFMMPSFLIMVLPISCMVSVFLAFLRMSTDRELVALKAGGISIYQMLRAPAFFSFVCMCLALFISLHLISWGMNNFRLTILHIANTRAKIVVQPGVFNRDMFGLTLFARKVDPATGRLQQVIFEDNTRDDKSSITVLAPEGEIVTDEHRGDLIFNMHNGRIYRVDNDNVSILEFLEYSIRLDLNKLFSSMELGDLKPKEMSWEALLNMHSQQNAPDKRFQNKVEVEIQKRWALPVACLVLGIFALPLACAFEGLKRQLGIVFALVLFLLYYSVFSLGLSTGEFGLLPPAVGIWSANVLFALAAMAGLHLTYKERAPSLARLILRLRQHSVKLFAAKKGSGTRLRGEGE